MSKHNWVLRSPGMYDSSYECRQCHKSHIVSIDDPSTELPIHGCKRKRALPSSKSVQLKDHQIAAMVNELSEIAKDYGKFDSIRERIRTVVIKHLKP